MPNEPHDEAPDEAHDDALDRCRHGRLADEWCEICDVDELDLRDQAEVDLTEVDADKDADG